MKYQVFDNYEFVCDFNNPELANEFVCLCKLEDDAEQDFSHIYAVEVVL